VTTYVYTGNRMLVAVGALIIGSMIFVGSIVITVSAWLAAHGAGRSGTFTLTEPLGCKPYEPPRLRCGWFGDFTSDDGTVTRRHMELFPQLRYRAAAGQTLRARDTGSLAQIYQEGDTQSWKGDLLFVAGGLAAIAVGILLLEPWQWRARLQQRRLRRSD
jgi:hypothetical protein